MQVQSEVDAIGILDEDISLIGFGSLSRNTRHRRVLSQKIDGVNKVVGVHQDVHICEGSVSRLAVGESGQIWPFDNRGPNATLIERVKNSLQMANHHLLASRHSGERRTRLGRDWAGGPGRHQSDQPVFDSEAQPFVGQSRAGRNRSARGYVEQ
jgi:hypothetical protein